MKVNIKRLHKDAVIPTYAKHGDAGMDLTAVSKSYDEHGNVVYGTGLAFEIPFGHAGYLFPRSSNAKKGLLLSNSVGVIDSGYRGEVLFKFKSSLRHTTLWTIIKLAFGFRKNASAHNIFSLDSMYQVGDRIGQIIIMPIPHIEFNEVDELSDSERGNGGFGSSGK